jgi:hypothetical protein
LFESGKTVDQVIELLAKHPTGIAQKYVKRLREAVEMCYRKWDARFNHPPQSAAAVETFIYNKGKLFAHLQNARKAILELGIVCRYDLFHQTKTMTGGALGDLAGPVTDLGCARLRDIISRQYDFDPGDKDVHDAVIQLCLRDRFNPVVEHLEGVEQAWRASGSNLSKVDTWLIDYLHVDDTPLNRAIGRIVLVAMCRRARSPGVKFDQIIVLEGAEGIDKSNAIAALAGAPENFSDQPILTLNSREQQEALKGRWLYEIADLTGMAESRVEKVKAFASRQFDRGRRVYDREGVDQARSTVFFATTNDDEYLKSQTGNRRFWPIRIPDGTRIDLEGLRRDRDMLLGEAAALESSGASIVLHESLWGAARVEQEKRREVSPWEDALAGVTGDRVVINGRVVDRVASSMVFAYLEIPIERVNAASKLVSSILKRLGWKRYKMRVNKNPPVWYWLRDVEH